jgi:small subunit ribosomal protein S20
MGLLLCGFRRKDPTPECRFPTTRESFNLANIKSQIKRNRQNENRRMRNKSINSNLKTSVKKVESAAAAGEPTDELLRQAQAKIDTAVSKGVLHKKAAARKKSRLAKRVTTSS